MMKAAIALAVALCWSFGAVAAEDAKPTTQQEKMKTCNAQAKEQKLKGDERKAFMSNCLKSDKKDKG